MYAEFVLQKSVSEQTSQRMLTIMS